MWCKVYIYGFGERNQLAMEAVFFLINSEFTHPVMLETG